MTKSTFPDDLKISMKHTVGDWKNLNLSTTSPDADWDMALSIFQLRVEGRYLKPADVLVREHSQGKTVYGFAILAIDFLVIETLQGFREGETDHSNISGTLITNFLKAWTVFKDAYGECESKPCNLDQLAVRVYKGYRCALHHSGATDGALRVLATGPAFDFRKFKEDKEITINRTQFHKELKCEFNRYLDKLRAQDEIGPRTNFIKKMNWICGIPDSK